jgi:cytochrome c oxidase subunit 2
MSVTAKKYEFSPSVITVKQGQHVKLEVTALDRTHGLAIKDYNIDTDLEKDKPATIEFVADKPGEFTFKCSDFCGLGHGKMKGKLVVTPAG